MIQENLIFAHAASNMHAHHGAQTVQENESEHSQQKPCSHQNSSIHASDMCLWLLLLAAGSGTRLSTQTQGLPKQFLHYNDIPLYMHSAVTQSRYPHLKGIVFVFPEEFLVNEQAYLEDVERTTSLGVQYKVVAGGLRRQDSVRLGLQALPPQCTHVLVHDSARPFASIALTHRLCAALESGAQGVIPALPVVDTIKEIKENIVIKTPERKELFSVQTPQAFVRTVLEQAHKKAEQEQWDVTDDASLLEKCHILVSMVEGEGQNGKITHAEDLMKLQDAPTSRYCSGFGYDVHCFAKKTASPPDSKERPLKLGGVLMDGGQKVLAHSDGDVLLHALMDALLGMAALGDIGLHFPDTSERFDNADSAVLLQEVLRLLRQEKIQIQHVDVTIITQKPKIHPQRTHIQKNLAHLLNLPVKYVNVKATTEEGLGFTGSGHGIKAVALVNGIQLS